MENKASINFEKVDKYYHDFAALKNITFSVSEGERVGIIGENGAGKTTLLNIIARYSDSTNGIVDIRGKVNAIMDLGVGVREELTGLENIILNGELNGKSRSQIENIIPNILDFADIGDYMYKPVKTYSTGMKARLSFSLLAFVDPEILLIDEVLGVGDASFVQKSVRSLEELCARGKILLVVSHSMHSIMQLTDRCLWLAKGELVMDGDPHIVCQAYLETIRKKEEEKLQERFVQRIHSRHMAGRVNISEFRFRNGQGEDKCIFRGREDFNVIIELETLDRISEWDIRISLYKMDGVLLFQNLASKEASLKLTLEAGEKYIVEAGYGEVRFADDIYELLVEVLGSDQTILARESRIFRIENANELYLSKPDYFCDYTIKG